MISQRALPPALLDASQSLGANLLACEPFVRYQEAKARFDSDTQAQTLLNQLAQAQANVRKRQADGGVTQADVEVLRDLQGRVQNSRSIMDYTSRQQEVVNFLRQVNQEISQLLGIDFAALANRPTC